MGNRNKQRGNELEREVVNLARKYRFYAKRAYASNGESLGLTEDVDVVVDDLKIQCKRRKKIAEYLYTDILTQKDGNFDAVVLRKDRQKPVIIMDLEFFMDRYLSAYLDLQDFEERK